MANPLALAGEYLPFMPRPKPRFVTEEGTRVHGMLAVFATPADLVHGCEKLRDAGYKRWDAHSPFPVHGMEEHMGIKRTILPVISFFAAMTGVVAALAMQYFMNAVDYQFVVQGKDFWAWEAYVPITFELGILFCAFATLGGMLAMNGLPRFHHPLFNSEKFLESSDDCLIIAVEADDEQFDPDATRTLLEDAGGRDIELVEDPEDA